MALDQAAAAHAGGPAAFLMPYALLMHSFLMSYQAFELPAYFSDDLPDSLLNAFRLRPSNADS
ncbi:hypothetical protein J21TS7_58990 [Paenibacillus cineris]|uniref:Uncharacterized protein n=1 Tax=Paenibacillus cineris TaxID=237530 RepID=A0ABQ4LM44_9BACL|nr:hypothetical protein J21TS7_58990 [Paenibacillus cineris]